MQNLTDYIPWLFIAKSTLCIPLSFVRVEKTKRDNLNFVYPFFLFHTLLLASRKLGECTNMMHTKQLCCCQVSFFCASGWRNSYNWQTVASKESHRMQGIVVGQLLWLLFMFSKGAPTLVCTSEYGFQTSSMQSILMRIDSLWRVYT